MPFMSIDTIASRHALSIALLTGVAVAPAQAADTVDIFHRTTDAVFVADTTAQAAAAVTDNAALDAAAQVTDYVGTGTEIAKTAAVGTTIATGSGATIMHTLAVVGGPVVLAGVTAASSAKLMNATLYNNCTDQSACDAAHYGTYGGAAAGTVGSAVTVAVVGAGPAGLATIGSIVGGGMAAGVGVLVAAPVVAAAAIGGAVYWLFSD